MTSGDVSYTKYRYTRCLHRVPTHARCSRTGVGYTRCRPRVTTRARRPRTDVGCISRGAWGDFFAGLTCSVGGPLWLVSVEPQLKRRSWR